jgi:hypothetical protein
MQMGFAKKQAGVERDIESDTSPEAGKVFTHEGAEGLYFFLAAFLQRLMESLDDWVMAHGG